MQNAQTSLNNCIAQKHEAKDEDALLQSLTDERAQLKARQEQINGELGTVKTRLDMDRKYREDAQKRLLECKAQEEINNKWQRMRQWIGNKDGSTFAAFVQNITFGTLLNAANRNLRLMSDRFTLVAKANSDDGNDKDLMDFSVEDSDFECTGAVSNLSGGEKFMVSLALALGIADFARGSVRIDSLFLDEGFGTLDNALLHRVIATLASLQKDGKMLGIITHVETVGEAIPLHIDVIPISDGKSRLQGAGVSGRTV